MKDTIISKKISLELKAIAVLLMVFLHLFAFSQRISNVEYISLGTLNGQPIEYYLACMGEICVGMFVFLSGYGLYQTYDKGVTYQGILSRILKLYQQYWKIFSVFVLIGLLMGVYQFDLINFILNILALKSSYNAEWWFIRLYVVLLLFYPTLIKISHRYPAKWILILSFVFNIGGFVFTRILSMINLSSILLELLRYFMEYQFYFICGVTIAKNGYFNGMRQKISFNKVTSIISTVIILGIISVSIHISVIGEIAKLILIPTFIFCVSLSLGQNNLLKWIGKHSTNIWLIHSFYCYYLFQNFTFMPRYSFLIFVWTIVLSITSGYFIDQFFIFISNCSVQLKHKNRITAE